MALLQLVSRLIAAGSDAGAIWAALAPSTRQAVIDFITDGTVQVDKYRPDVPRQVKAMADGGRCTAVGYHVKYSTRLFGITIWTFQAAMYFCYDGFKITYASEPIVRGEAHWTWEYKGLVGPIGKVGGVGFPMEEVYIQGHFVSCPAWIVPCLKTMDPWIRLEAHGDGSSRASGHV